MVGAHYCGLNKLDCEGTSFRGNFSKLGSFRRSRKRAAYAEDDDDEVDLRVVGRGVGIADKRAFLGAVDEEDVEARLVRHGDWETEVLHKARSRALIEPSFQKG